jgi:hypothetical protein
MMIHLSYCTMKEEENCPEGCRCIARETGTFTACIGVNLTSIPKNIPANTEELYLKENSIEVLHQESFAGLTQLRTLVLTKCGIQTIEPNAFAGLRTLGSLDLRWNNIRELQMYTFSGLSQLKRLDLDDNKIEVIHNFAFHGLNLTKLSLQKNEHLSEFSSKAFYGARIHDFWIFNASISSKSTNSLRPLASSLRELHWQNNQKPLVLAENLFQGFAFRILDLKYNGIENTSFLKHTNTDDLSLDGNPTGIIMFSRYPNLRQVRKIRLANTGFTQPEGGHFVGLVNLNQLYLNENGITHLPQSLQSTFSTLDRVVLEGNPLHCNCEILWLRQWLYTTDVNVLGAACATPEINDVLVVPEEVFQCVLPSIVDITRSINISASNELFLTCTASGDPSPTIVWELPNGKHVPSKQQTHTNLTANTGVLAIKSGNERDAGLYHCIASNVEGNATAIANVDIYTIIAAGSRLTPSIVYLTISLSTFFLWMSTTDL